MLVLQVIVITLFEFSSVVISSPPGDDFSITVNTDGTYSIYVSTQPWLSSAPTFFNADGQTFSTRDGTLQLLQISDDTGSDTLGQWQVTRFHYVAGSAEIIAGIKVYTKPYRPLVVFSQTYLNGGNDTHASTENDVIGGFPGFNVGGGTGQLGYLSYGGMMAGDTDRVAGLWHNTTASIKTGLAGGPLAIYDRYGQAVIISPFSQFMSASSWHDGLLGGAVYWGIMGNIDEVPEGFTMETIVYYSNAGINQAFRGWGDILQTRYGKSSSFRQSDFTLNYLGYWTDNGAFYYYNTERHKNYEDTMLDVKNYTDSLNMPYRYVQYDSWWYYKGVFQGVTLWEPMADIFPHGLQYLYNKTGWPAAAHNRYWSSLNKYAKQNGGTFDFIVETETALPLKEGFWDYLMRQASKWGLVLYEQDWLNIQFKHLSALLRDINLGRDWLIQMGNGARANGITIQYCMSNPRHVLQSVEISAVTQVRVSDDYSPGEDQWKIGVTSIFAHAVGLAPFKDTFWTTQTQPNNPYNEKETQPGLNAVVATLSTGPVGPGDMIGGTNYSLLMRCCNADGLILKPSKPATAIDAQLLEASFQDGGGPSGEVWSTFSLVSGRFYGTILAADLTGPYQITPELAGFGYYFTGPNVIFSYRDYHLVSLFDRNNSLTLEDCTPAEFCLYHTTPVINFRGKDICILGEVEKWVPMSPQRVMDVSIGDDIVILLTGSPGELFQFWFTENFQALSVQCTLNQSGTATLRYTYSVCN